MSEHPIHTQGDCWAPTCPICAAEDDRPTALFADDDADNNPTIWAQSGDEQPRAVLRLTALEAADDREELWARIVDALEAAQQEVAQR